MTDVHAIKASISVLLSAGIWGQFAESFPEQIPLVAFSGFFGGLSRWIALREKWWPDGLGTIVVGVTAAVFLSPIAEPLLSPVVGKLEMEPVVANMFGGFVTGLMGVSLIGLLLDVIRARRKEVQDDPRNEG